MIRPTMPIFSVLSSTRIREAYRRLAGDRRIEDMRVPLAVVAADIVTRREVVFRHGPVWQAVLASGAMPGVFPPQRVGPYVLVDGAVLNPVPCRVAAEMGANIVIGVRLDDPSATRDAPMEMADAEAVGRTGRLPSILQVIMRSIEMMESQITADTAATATLLIEPRFKDTPRPWFHRFAEGRPHIEVGEAAAEAALPRIASLLPWLRG